MKLNCLKPRQQQSYMMVGIIIFLKKNHAYYVGLVFYISIDQIIVALRVLFR